MATVAKTSTDTANWPARSAILLALAMGLAIAAYGLYRQASAAPISTDFEVFWRAARHATDPWLYDAAHLNAGQRYQPGAIAPPFAYPPTFLLLAWPFGLLPYQAGYLLWVAFSCAAFVAAATRLVKPGWAALVLPLSFPVMVAAAYGQSTLFAGAALVAGVVLLERRPLAAGVLLALAACIKPQVMLLSPILLIGHWRAIQGAALGGLALVAASCVFGPQHWLEWPRAVMAFDRIVNQLPLAFANPSRLAPGPWGQVLVATLGVGFAAWSARGDAASRIAGVVIGSLCCTPYATRNDFALLAPAALVWIMQPASIAGWIRRAMGAAVLLGLIVGPLSLLGLMAAKLAADAPEMRRSWQAWRGRPPRMLATALEP